MAPHRPDHLDAERATAPRSPRTQRVRPELRHALGLSGFVLLAALGGAWSTQAGPRPRPTAPPPSSVVAPPPSVPPPAAGAVASPHPLSTRAGASMLQAGGTAFDAAVATALAMGVVHPQSSGLGGGGFAVYRQPGQKPAALDFREMAPAWANEDSFADGTRSPTRGAWSVAVPGESRGLGAVHAAGGKLPWSAVVEPARALAADGFPISKELAEALAKRSAEVLADPGLRADFAPAGLPLKEGEICKRPALARTLEYLQLHGPDGLHRGPLAVALAGFVASKGAPLTEADLAAYRVVPRSPVSLSYRGWQVHSMAPPSSGGFVIAQSLGILERAGHAKMVPFEPDWTRTLAGALRHAFADRATYGADPDAYEVPLTTLLAPSTLDTLAGVLPARGPVPLRVAGWAGQSGEIRSVLPEDGGTAHLSALDTSGGVVALTSTVNLDFGALIADPQTGVVLNDQMDDFAAVPGKANAFGLMQSARNAPKAGRRPLSSMSPTLVLDGDGDVRLVVGGAGGPRIITGTLQTLLAVLDRGADATAALASPRIHHQWLPDLVEIEGGAPAATGEALRAEGFTIEAMRGRAVVQAIVVGLGDGAVTAAGDPRAVGTGEVVGR